MRRFHKSFAVLALACGLSAAATAAQQDPSSPQTGSWIVAPIASGKFCSMKNAWQGGRRLVFARDAAGVNSIAVDFGGDVLQAGHQYPVTLDLPPLATREMTAVAATRDILLVGMGRDKDFYAALGRAKSLYLTALNREYGFELAGSTDALRELDGCASGLSGQGKVAEETSAAPKPRMKASRTVAGAFSAEKARLEAARATEEKKRIEETARLKADLAAAATARKQAAAAQAENARLRESLASTQDARKENTALDAENRRLRENLASLRRDADQARAAEAENARLRESLASAQDARKESAALQAENGRLAAALSKAQQELVSSAAALTIPVAPAKEDRIVKILGDSGVVPEEGLAAHDSGGVKTFKWQSSDGVLGSAEESRLGPDEDFGRRVSAWLGRMAARCRDDFAHTSAVPEAHGGMTMQKAEVACMGDKAGAAAAVLFVGDGGTFAAVMHETAPDAIETALAKRNAIALTAAAEAQ